MGGKDKHGTLHNIAFLLIMFPSQNTAPFPSPKTIPQSFLHTRLLMVSGAQYLLLLYLSVSTRSVIGQFCGPYFTVRSAKFESCSFPAPPINLRDILINILQTSFSQSVLQVTDPRSFPLMYGPPTINQRGKKKTRSVTYSTTSNSVSKRYDYI